jgi:hypothetical protein
MGFVSESSRREERNHHHLISIEPDDTMKFERAISEEPREDGNHGPARPVISRFERANFVIICPI